MTVKPIRLGLSAGHGGADLGTTSGAAHGLIEAEATREIIDGLAARLPPGLFDVHQLNAHGETVGPTERGNRARQKRLDFVLSCHVNEQSGGGHSSHGLHAFYRPGSRIGMGTCEMIARSAPSLLRRRHLWGVRADGRYIAGGCEPALSVFWPRVAAVADAYAPIEMGLVEMLYASNDGDAKAWAAPETKLGIVACLVAGLCEAYRLLSLWRG